MEHDSLIDLLTDELVICLPLFINTYPSIEEVWFSIYLSNICINVLDTDTYLGADLFLVPFKNISNLNSLISFLVKLIQSENLPPVSIINNIKWVEAE